MATNTEDVSIDQRTRNWSLLAPPGANSDIALAPFGRPEVRERQAAAGSWISFRQQVWLLGVSGRWVFLILGLVGLELLIAWSDFSGDGWPPTAATFALPAAGIWAMMVWWGEGSDRRSYHWSLPIPRPVHDLMRVAAGAPYLLGAYAVLTAASAISAAAQGQWDQFAAMWPEAWTILFVAPVIAYLLVSPLLLWSDHAITRWVYGGILAMPILTLILDWQGNRPIGTGINTFLFWTKWGLGTALFRDTGHDSPLPLELWWPAAVLWFLIALGLTLFTGIYRPADLRRLLRGTHGSQRIESR